MILGVAFVGVWGPLLVRGLGGDGDCDGGCGAWGGMNGMGCVWLLDWEVPFVGRVECGKIKSADR